MKRSLVEVNLDYCTACRSCELACHFRNTSSFGTSHSFIDVNLNKATGEVQVDFLEACDNCREEPFPYCYDACCTGAITWKLVNGG